MPANPKEPPFGIRVGPYEAIRSLFSELLTLTSTDQALLKAISLSSNCRIPEIQRRTLGFRCDGVEHIAVYAKFAITFQSTAAGYGDTYIDGYGRRNGVLYYLPAIAIILSFQCVSNGIFPELSWLMIDGRTRQFLVADAAGVDAGLVSEVHQIVDQQLVIAFKFDGPPSPTHSGWSFQCRSGTSDSSALSWSPIQTQTKRCFCTEGKDFTQALRGIMS
jgi:hypothetical protein